MSTPQNPSDRPGGWQPGPPPPPPSQNYPPPPQQGYGPPPQQGYGQPPPYGQGQRPPQTEGTAITALVLSIASFVICPVIPAIVALFLVGSAKRKIETSGGALTGEGLVTAAKIVSWVNLGLWGAGIVLFGILIAIGVATEDESSLALSLLG
jgi:Domain of unknown function (DUF4190)